MAACLNLNGLDGEFQIIRGTFTSTQLLQIVTNYLRHQEMPSFLSQSNLRWDMDRLENTN